MSKARDMADIISTPPSLYATDAEVAASYLTLSSASSNYQLVSNQPTVFRNRIINGDFSIAQRGIGPTNVTLNGPGFTTVDRFFSYQNTSVGVQTSQVTSDLLGFRYMLKWGRPSGNTTTGITVMGTVLETANSIPLQGKTVTFSFYAKRGANLSGTPSFAVYSGTGTDQSVGLMITNSWTGWTTPGTIVPSLTTSWQRFSTTFTVPSNSTQLGLYNSWTPAGTAGADDYLYVTGIQLEEGTQATPFEFRPIGTELALCQRYYQRLDESRAFVGTNGGGGTAATFRYSFPVTMRAAPTITAQNIRVTDYYTLGGSATLTGSWLTDKYHAGITTGSGPNYGGSRCLFLESSGGTSYVDFSIEL